MDCCIGESCWGESINNSIYRYTEGRYVQSRHWCRGNILSTPARGGREDALYGEGGKMLWHFVRMGVYNGRFDTGAGGAFAILLPVKVSEL